MKKYLFTLTVLTILHYCVAQTPIQIKDINPGSTGSIPSYANFIAEYKGKLYFAANDGVHGTELWTTDGTENGTVLVKDIFPGAAGSDCQHFYIVNDYLLFTATTSLGIELWRTDGTAAGTVLVKDINAGSASGIPATWGPSIAVKYYVWNDVLYFAGNNGVSGEELWRSDGTESGTYLVKDIEPFFGVNGHGDPENFAEHNGLLYFSASGLDGAELWVTDGTGAGTKQVANISASFGSDPNSLVSCNGYLLFVASANFSDPELWRSNGTQAGTAMVKNINPTGGGLQTQPNATEQRLVKIGNTVYFSANNGVNGIELWKSDGTEAGTSMVKDASTDNPGYAPQNFAVLNDVLYYKYENPAHGQELWRSDGTEAGTYMVKDMTPGPFGSFALPTSIAAVGDKLFFGAANSGSPFNIELWKSDGTEAGTVLVADLFPAGSSYPSRFVEYQDYMVFVAYGIGGYELWKLPLTPSVPLAGQIQIASSLDCFGDTDGALVVETTGGRTPYTYAWTPPSIQGVAPAGLAAGNYTVTVTDSEGSSIAFQINLPQPPVLTVGVGSTPEAGSAMNGTVVAAANGGTPPYTYSWNTAPPANTPAVSNLSAGTYLVLVTDANGCMVENDVEVGKISSVDEALQAKFRVVPTLSQGYFSIACEQPVHNMEIRLYDPLGREVKRWENVANGQLLEATEIPDNQYFLQVRIGNQSFAKKLILTSN